MSLLPCATCPWRVDQDASVIPNYKSDLACGLTRTCGSEDGFRKIMACHGSATDNMTACRGYLAKEGWRNINVRILLAQGKIEHPDQVADACDAAGIELHPDYDSVLAKLEGRLAHAD